MPVSVEIIPVYPIPVQKNKTPTEVAPCQKRFPESEEPQYDLLLNPEPVSLESSPRPFWLKQPSPMPKEVLELPKELEGDKNDPPATAAEFRLRRAQAKVLFREAEKCHQEGKEDRASYLFEQVIHLSPDASLVARAQNLGRFVKARMEAMTQASAEEQEVSACSTLSSEKFSSRKPPRYSQVRLACAREAIAAPRTALALWVTWTWPGPTTKCPPPLPRQSRGCQSHQTPGSLLVASSMPSSNRAGHSMPMLRIRMHRRIEERVGEVQAIQDQWSESGLRTDHPT